MNIQLYIEGKEVELNEQVKFVLTKQFDELSNPTIICNDYSKTVNIPFTASNNKLFGEIYKHDRQIAYNGTATTGIYFDPYKKLDFKLIYNGDVVMNGYAKMNSITKDGGTGQYNISLNGQLGKIFQEMKKITLISQDNMDEYYMDTTPYLETKINKDLIYTCWNSNGQSSNTDLKTQYINVMDPTTGEIYKVANINWKVTDYIGFAPNNSYDDNFDYNTFQLNPTQSKKFHEVLGDNFYNDTGITADTVIKDGLLPRDIGEYRSYLQIPYIYFNKLFKLFQKKSEQITGYTFNLDNSWFNNNNPYWKKLVYTLKKLDITKATPQYLNNYSFMIRGSQYECGRWPYNASDFTSLYRQTFNAKDGGNYSRQGSGVLEEQLPVYYQYYEYETGTITLLSAANQWTGIPSTISNMSVHMKVPFRLYYATSSGTNIKQDQGLKVHFIMQTGKASGNYDITNIKEQIVKFMIVDKNTTLNEGDYPEYQFIRIDKVVGYNDYTYQGLFDLYFKATPADGERAKFFVERGWLENTFPMTEKQALIDTTLCLGRGTESTELNIVDITINTNSLRSDGIFTINDLWNKEYNLFEEIIKYCKIFRILITIDESKKQINFIPANKYFENYKIEDWTNKVDLSREYTITPVSWENKYVLFNYKNGTTKLEKEYLEKYGLQYGSYRLITDYNFNSETTELFKNISTPFLYTDNVLSWTNLYERHKIIYSLPAETYLYCQNDRKNYVDSFGKYFFHGGASLFSTEETLHLRNVSISDDTALQLGTNIFFYSQSTNSRQTTKYTLLKCDEQYNNKQVLCLFNKPMQQFTYNDRLSGGSSIYSLIWENYVNERYNIQNKKVTCYINLTQNDYINFEFNKFILIDHQLYMVNKIYDYDLTSPESVKVDLITITDIEGYTKNNL